MLSRESRWGRVIGVATWSADKFAVLTNLARSLGITSQLVQLPMEFNLEEGASEQPREAGKLKIRHFAPAINEFLATIDPGSWPDAVMVMDVLPIAQVLEWKPAQRILKKPAGEGTALEVTTAFFAEASEAKIVEETGYLPVIYNLIHVWSRVDLNKGTINPFRPRGGEVVHDKVELSFSRELIAILADPGKLRKLAIQHPVGMAELLTGKSVRGFRMSVLVPIVTTLAAQGHGDHVNLRVRYERVNYDGLIDDHCDLEGERIEVGTKVNGLREIRLQEFLHGVAQNCTPYLVHDSMLGKPGSNR